jgi:hypothetical protein
MRAPDLVKVLTSLINTQMYNSSGSVVLIFITIQKVKLLIALIFITILLITFLS